MEESNKPVLVFQDIITYLQNYWARQGCLILQPYHTEVGAGTLHPATVLHTLVKDVWKVAYVQNSIRPKDGRYGNNPNRLQSYYQFQVILKPSPENIQDLYLNSLKEIGIDPKEHDIRFVEDDWENPTVGAWGLGWEVWCDGMEISQFTYMQQVGGIDCIPVPGEITFGLERIAMYIQSVDSVYDIVWNDQGVLYGDILKQNEEQFSAYNMEYANKDNLYRHFEDNEKECLSLIEKKLSLVAYDFCLKSSHILNLLDSRGVLSVTERESFIARVRNMARKCCELHISIF